jgi:hypothetical protein
VDSDKAIQDTLVAVEAITSTVNELVVSYNGMAEDMAVVLSRTQALEETVTTMAKAGLKWGTIAEDNNKMARQVEGMANANSKALAELTKIAEANARVLEELRKRVG